MYYSSQILLSGVSASISSISLPSPSTQTPEDNIKEECECCQCYQASTVSLPSCYSSILVLSDSLLPSISSILPSILSLRILYPLVSSLPLPGAGEDREEQGQGGGGAAEAEIYIQSCPVW